MYGGGSRRPTTLRDLAAILLTSGLLALTAAGCGGNGAASDTTAAEASSTDSTASTIASSTSETSGTTTSTTSATEPAGEIGATALVASVNGAYPKENAPDWSEIKSVEAYHDASYGVASIWVSLATYEVTAGSIFEYRDLPYPPAGQGRIELLLTRTLLDVNEPPLVAGTYDFNIPQGQAELTGQAAIVLPGGTEVTFAKGALESDVQVTVVTDTYVSGTFHVKDKWSEISGTFTAPVK